MTTLTDAEAAARLMGASATLAATLRPLVSAVDTLADPTHSAAVRAALALAAEHVRTAADLLEATSAASEPRRDDLLRQMDEAALTRRVQAHRL